MKLQQHWRWLLITVLVLGWLLDVLFWRQRPGINFALYAVLCLVGGLFIMRLGGQRAAPMSRWLIPPTIAFAALTSARAEPITLFLSAALTLLLMAVLATTFAGGRWLRYGILDYALNFLRLARTVLMRPLPFFAEAAREPEHQAGSSGRWSWWPVARGVVIALPILLVFGALLASADLVFGRELSSLLRLLQLERLPEYIFRLVYILLAAYALAGVFLHAAMESRDESLQAGRKPLVPQFLGSIEAAIVLGSVAVLFAAFVIVQFRYFFGGQQNIGIAGYTYSDYARRGFGELVVVAVLSVLLIVGLGAVTSRPKRSQQSLFSGLSTAILVLVAVILISAYRRLSLYEVAYGFTRLRTYTHVLLIWTGLMLVAVVLLEWVHRERMLPAAALLAALGFVLSLGLLNVDAFIASQNIHRAAQGQPLDVPYLVSLSTDADPVLVQAFADAEPVPVHEAIGAALACRLELSAGRSTADWRSLTLSQLQSERAIQEIRGQLSAYYTAAGKSPPQTIAPSGTVYDCFGSHD